MAGSEATVAAIRRVREADRGVREHPAGIEVAGLEDVGAGADRRRAKRGGAAEGGLQEGGGLEAHHGFHVRELIIGDPRVRERDVALIGEVVPERDRLAEGIRGRLDDELLEGEAGCRPYHQPHDGRIRGDRLVFRIEGRGGGRVDDDPGIHLGLGEGVGAGAHHRGAQPGRGKQGGDRAGDRAKRRVLHLEGRQRLEPAIGHQELVGHHAARDQRVGQVVRPVELLHQIELMERGDRRHHDVAQQMHVVRPPGRARPAKLVRRWQVRGRRDNEDGLQAHAIVEVHLHDDTRRHTPRRGLDRDPHAALRQLEGLGAQRAREGGLRVGVRAEAGPGRAPQVAVAHLPVARTAQRHHVAGQGGGEGGREWRRTAHPTPLIVVVIIAKHVEPEAQHTTQDARHRQELGIPETPPSAADLRQRGRAIDQEEGPPIAARAAILPLVERRDEAGGGGNRTVIEDVADSTEQRIGQLQVAGCHAARGHVAGIKPHTVRDLRLAGRRRAQRARQAGRPVDREVRVRYRCARERLVDQQRATHLGDGGRHPRGRTEAQQAQDQHAHETQPQEARPGPRGRRGRRGGASLGTPRMTMGPTRGRSVCWHTLSSASEAADRVRRCLGTSLCALGYAYVASSPRTALRNPTSIARPHHSRHARTLRRRRGPAWPACRGREDSHKKVGSLSAGSGSTVQRATQGWEPRQRGRSRRERSQAGS